MDMALKFITKLFFGSTQEDNPQYTMGMHQSKHYTKNEPSSIAPDPTTFGQDRAIKMEERLRTAITDRQRLARAQGVSAADLQTYYDRKAQIAENRIKRLQDSSADSPPR